MLAGAIHAALLASAERVVRTCHDFALPDGDVTPIGDALAQTVAAHRLLSAMDHAA